MTPLFWTAGFVFPQRVPFGQFVPGWLSVAPSPERESQWYRCEP